MKLNVAQFYQAIRINGETLTRINVSPAQPDMPKGEKHGRMELELKDGVGVIITTTSESVIVPLNNVAYAVLAKEVKQKEQKAEKK